MSNLLMICPHCASSQLSLKAVVEWKVESQRYESIGEHGEAYCEDCLQWSPNPKQIDLDQPIYVIWSSRCMVDHVSSESAEKFPSYAKFWDYLQACRVDPDPELQTSYDLVSQACYEEFIEEAGGYVERDHILEAFEDGHAHSVSGGF